MTKRRYLNDTLQKLQDGADEQYEAYRRSHEHLWQLLAKSYLWWREASQESGYLEDLYKQRDIAYRTVGNRPNFNRLDEALEHIVE